MAAAYAPGGHPWATALMVGCICVFLQVCFQRRARMVSVLQWPWWEWILPGAGAALFGACLPCMSSTDSGQCQVTEGRGSC